MKYVGRAVRYLLKMVVLFAVLLAVIYLLGYAKPQFWTIFFRWQGLVLAVIVVGWAFVYARTGFVKYVLKMGLASNRAKIIEAMSSVGYRLSGEELGEMRFRAHSFATRLTLMGDDLIVIRAAGDEAVEVEGARSVVSKVEFRLIRAANDEQD